MRVAYADPPYPGQSEKHYGDHPDFDGEVDHDDLLRRLQSFDCWVLHTSSVALRYVLPICPPDVRVMAWVKPFAAYKRNVSLAYAWEPVITHGGRRATPNRFPGGPQMRDFLAEPITMKKGLAGAKPEAVCVWVFEAIGLEPDDDLVDLFPGTGAVTKAWERWKAALLAGDANLDGQLGLNV